MKGYQEKYGQEDISREMTIGFGPTELDGTLSIKVGFLENRTPETPSVSICSQMRTTDGLTQTVDRNSHSFVQQVSLGGRHREEISSDSTLSFSDVRCPEDWIAFGNNCYFLSQEKAIWDEAKSSCEELHEVEKHTEVSRLSPFYRVGRWPLLTLQKCRTSWRT